MTGRPWHEEHPELVVEVRGDLAQYPNLHLFLHTDGNAEVRGTFPVRAPDGEELDSFGVSIELPSDYPSDLPVVREVGGRIPWTQKRHVHPVGTATPGVACIIVPDDRWRCFPIGARFLDYLRGPLHNYFLGQMLAERGEPWPFDEWDHGERGVLQYYEWLLGAHHEWSLGADKVLTVSRFLHVLASRSLERHWDCPCGSGKKIRKCCDAKLGELRLQISRSRASEVLLMPGFLQSTYNGSRLTRRI